MTMRVKVTNDDAVRSLRVTPLDVPAWAAKFEASRGGRRPESRDLAPGQSEEFHVHNGRVLICEEI